MKNSIKIPLVIIILVLICCILLQSCEVILTNLLFIDFGNRDWRIIFDNGFQLQQLNGKKILLIKDCWSETSDIVIPSTVSAFCRNGQYLGIQCFSDYYVVDTVNDELFGPYSNEQFNLFCFTHGINGLDHWTPTSPRPEEAMYS